MPDKETVKRYLIFAAGVFFSALGIGFISRGALGTSPISSIPFVLSLVTKMNLGVFTFVFNMLFLAGEVLVRRSFGRTQALQIPFVVLFSLCIDAAMRIIPTQLYGPYPAKAAYLLLGCLLMSFGITLEVFGGVVMLPGEALVRAMTVYFGRSFCRLPDGGIQW